MYNVLQLDSIRREHLNLLYDIELSEGEVTPEIEQQLQLNKEQLQESAISLGHVINTIEYNQEVVELEIKRLEKMQSVMDNAVTKLKERITQAMDQYGIERINSPTLKLSFRKSQAVEIIDSALIPPAYNRPVVISLYVNQIKQDLKAGVVVPGAQLEERRHLQIK